MYEVEWYDSENGRAFHAWRTDIDMELRVEGKKAWMRKDEHVEVYEDVTFAEAMNFMTQLIEA